MIFFKIFISELTKQFRRITTWSYLLVLFSFSIVMILVPTPGDGIFPNSSFLIHAVTIMGGLIWLMVSGTIAGEAAAGDVQSRMHPLIYTSPVSKLNYLGGKFLAAFATNAILMLSLPIGILLFFYLPGIERDELLAFKPEVYLYTYLTIALPFIFIASAFQFSTAALSGKVMASYIASLLLAIFPQIIAVSLSTLSGNWALSTILDPVGIFGILGGEMKTWTAPEKNTRIISLEGMFLWNRILWLGIAIGLLFLTYLRFKFNTQITNTWWSHFRKPAIVQSKTYTDSKILKTPVIKVLQVQQSFGLTSHFYQMFTIALASFKKIATHPIGLTLVGAIAIGSAFAGIYIINDNGIPMLPTTQLILTYFTAPVNTIGTPWVIIPLLIIYFVAELIWQERDKDINEIFDVTPVPNWVIFVGKFWGLSLIIFVWMSTLMIGGLLMQKFLGAEHSDINLYLQTLFGLQLLDYLLFALMVFVIFVIVNQKHIGYLLVLLFFSFIAFPSKFSIDHNMLIYGSDPGWWYTDMRGFGTTLGPWLWFKAYWILWALLLAVASILLWARGKEQNLSIRLQMAKNRFNGSILWISILIFLLIVSLGSYIFYNTNVLNEYLTASDLIERNAEYERRFGRYRNTPQPQLTNTKLNVDLYPGNQEIKILGTYTLVNNDTVSIDTIHLGNASGIEFNKVKFNRPASVVVNDKEFSHHIFKLGYSLNPGDSLQISFEVNYIQQGFKHKGTKPLIVENGTYFTNVDLVPTIGYLNFREINDAATRKKYRLPARPEIPSLYDLEARKIPFSQDQTTFEAIISTPFNEVAVAPGTLRRTWTKDDRRYFHYDTGGAIGGEYSLLSANYAVRESKWKDVAIKIFYHPGHANNIDRMLNSIKASLEFYTEQFGPYPFRYFTAVESPGPGSGASADAGIIYYGEHYPLFKPDSSPEGFDLPYYIMAHEVAHQWWGLARLNPAYVEGAGLLIESLSVYSGMQVLEKTYGDGHLQKYIEYLHSSYALPRSLASASLLQANDPFLNYKKGGLAMYALSKYISKEKVNGALKSFLQRRDNGKLPLPTTLDLYHELQQVTPDSLNYLLEDLFKENTYWRLKTKQFTVAETEEGEWEVTLKVEAQKVVVDMKGSENQVPMNDWLEIGIYEEGADINLPLYLKMHRIKSGEQIISVIVPRKPKSGGIDPNHLMIDLRLEDNIMNLGG